MPPLNFNFYGKILPAHFIWLPQCPCHGKHIHICSTRIQNSEELCEEKLKFLRRTCRSGIVAAILNFGVEHTTKYHTRSKACFVSRRSWIRRAQWFARGGSGRWAKLRKYCYYYWRKSCNTLCSKSIFYKNVRNEMRSSETYVQFEISGNLWFI